MMKLDRTVVSVVVAAFCFHLAAASWAETSGEKEESGHSREDTNWAVHWINNRLSLLMEEGLVTRIKPSSSGDSYTVFVSSAWQLLTTGEKEAFLRDFSRARQLTGHSPYVVVKRDGSEQMIAEVNRQGIFLYGGEEQSFFPRDP